MFRKWDEKTNDGQLHYDIQTKIVRSALDRPGHSLDTLLDLMRTYGEAAVYFCGTRLDNDFGYGSNDVGIALSVLPQDGDKAAEPGYHPGSTEVYVIFQGSLVMEKLKGDSLEISNCGQFDVLVLPPGQCHRVRYEPDRLASSLIVKTNPHHDPKVVRCNYCYHFSDKGQCRLYRSWNKDCERMEHGKHK